MADDEPDIDHDTPSPAADAEPAAAPVGRRTIPFNPRMAAIFATGALIIVLVFALAVSIQKDRDASEQSATTDGTGTIDLNVKTAEFTATRLPDAGLLTLEGKVVDLADLTAGKPAMINFFSRACTACRDEMPALEALHGQVGDQVRLIGVNLGDSEKVTESFVADMGVTYPIARDPNLLMVNRLAISAQPLTIWADASGKITGHRYGGMTPTEMRAELRDHLGVDVPVP